MSDASEVMPRFGSFVTMIVGLLLFFGFLSRIHQVPGPVLSASRRNAHAQHADSVADEMNRSAVVFGSNPDEQESLPGGSGVLDKTLRETPLEQLDNGAKPVPVPALRDTPPPVPMPAPASPRTRPEPQKPRPGRIHPQAARKYYAVRSGDTLWRIAQREYGNGSLYRMIQRANPGISPSYLPVGYRLVIPPIERVASR